MNRFYTPVRLYKSAEVFGHSDRFYFCGSCFSSHLSAYLAERGFRVMESSFGISYNPLSLAEQLGRELRQQPLEENLLLERQGLYCSYLHHGSCARETKEAFLQESQQQLATHGAYLRRAEVLVLTLGTAYVYRLKEDALLVSNCHKQPEDKFLRDRVEVEEVVAALSAVLHELFLQNARVKVLFTVSPIRHQRDGMHQNTLSKAILHLSVERLQQMYPERVSYFPAYEILLDELRDYRFYAPDLLHPSPAAIAYIMEQFAAHYLSEESRTLAAAFHKASLFLAHRPSEGQAAAHSAAAKTRWESLVALRDKEFPSQN